MGSLCFFFYVKDGADLSPPILFDVNEDFHLPSNKGSYLCAQEGVTVVRQFLEQYYQLYDSDNREPLLSAYHPEAMFSITSAYPPVQSSAISPK
jgi:nuclear RNA export factor